LLDWKLVEVAMMETAMPATFKSLQIRHDRDMMQRFAYEHRIVGEALARIVIREANGRNDGGETIVPNTRAARDNLKRAMWAQVLKPYYVGLGTDAFDGAMPMSPFAQLISDGVSGAVRIQVDRQTAILRKVVKDRQVLNYLTGHRPIRGVREMVSYNSALQYIVDPQGYLLSDRIWRTSIDVRSRIATLLDYEIGYGTAAVKLADKLVQYLTPGAMSTRTRTPYGTEGSYAARRLARTEITAAAGRATQAASNANPFVNRLQWVLSGSHPEEDICDDNARGGPDGDGVYAIDELPEYPAHPHDMCTIRPVPAQNAAEIVSQLRIDMQRPAPAYQGLFNAEFLTNAIVLGFLGEAIANIGSVAA
jgi:hypothetical protein